MFNFGEEGSSIPQGRKDVQLLRFWAPATPEKSVPSRSNLLEDDRQNYLGRRNGHRQAQGPSGYEQQQNSMSSCAAFGSGQYLGQIDQIDRSWGCNASSAEMQRMIAGSYSQTLQDRNGQTSSLLNCWTMNFPAPLSSPGTTFMRGVSNVERPAIPDLHSRINCCRESNSTKLSFTNLTNCSSSSLLCSNSNSTQRHHYGFPLPSCKNNPNSSPGAQANAIPRVTSTFQFTPNRSVNNQHFARIDLSTAANSNDEGKHQETAISATKEANHCILNELFNNIGNKSPAIISTPLEEPKDPDMGSKEVIDLNKTPSQKPPRRKKHRPKVIVEGKPKRTPKVAAPKPSDSKEKLSGKRKYVRKNQLQDFAKQHTDSIEDTRNHIAGKRKYVHKKGLEGSVMQHANPTEAHVNPITRKRKYVGKKGLEEQTTQHSDSIGRNSQPSFGKRKYVQRLNVEESAIQNTGFIREKGQSSAQTAVPSCRKALNFDLESTSIEGLSVASQEQEIQHKKRLEFNTIFEAMKTNNGPSTVCKTALTLQVGQNDVLLEENQQLEDISGVHTSMNSLKTYTNGRMQNHNVGVGHTVFPSIQWLRKMMPQHITQSYSIEGGGSNTEYCRSQQATTFPGRSPFFPAVFQVEEHTENPSISGTHKRKKIEHGIQNNSFQMPSCIAAVKGCQPTTSYGNDINAFGSTLWRKYEAVNLRHESNKMRDNQWINKSINDACNHPTAWRNNSSKPNLPLELQSCIEMAGETNGLTQVHNFVSSITRGSCGTIPTGAKASPNIQKYHQQFSGKRQGRAAERKYPDPVAQIIYQMDSLNLNGRSSRSEQNALVPYKGHGNIIPYSRSENIKKQKPRPKVDLDPETERVWRLLMSKEGSENPEETDKKKEHWWEEERKIFSSRVDSFIARMHLVQGDRRFSKWKGSVVDSVIGVFLTQNVSDHLSSSAFMSLAALFPLKSRQNRTCDKNGSNIIVEEPDICILNPNDAIKRQDALLSYDPLCNIETHHESAKEQREIQLSTAEPQNHSLEEEALSSQDSFDSSIIQAKAGVRSYSGSNCEAEPASGIRPKSSQTISFTDLLQMEDTIPFHYLTGESSLTCQASGCGHLLQEDMEYGQQSLRLERIDSFNYPFDLNKMSIPRNLAMQGQSERNAPNNYHGDPNIETKVQDEQTIKCNSEESTSSWPSLASTFTEVKYANCTLKGTIREAESVGRTPSQQRASTGCHEASLLDPHASSSRYSVIEPSDSQLHWYNHCDKNSKSSPSERTSAIKPKNHADEIAKGQNYDSKQISNVPKPLGDIFDVMERTTSMATETCLANNLVELYPKEVHFPDKEKTVAGANTLKASKGKVRGGKKDAFDWDSLRKQVQENGIRERSQDTMDSLDYEELRCASVKMISEAIKERGMNNMLAERIKDFLNRLVSDHGSIDLEWLRDVPSDKAKDYLLSIRGLGLKSVECVRLLTLHHLAFPVDTNVGRIAVRLGWVPLQPLPESLQLHLLELYELHYQMITFGKVFCTKNRPNCNACPMRAECRHFASAFASARLALPGPEERSITSRTIPSVAERNRSEAINLMMLPQSEDDSLKSERSEIDNCVPIVEEPATPDQQQTWVTESDIEDAFDEDPDEIPTIRLNMEEFTVSLQNYMQTSMELQEGDMSKALVSLNPDVASIPAPKLKNVSRLRTEHRVYELPDSHPLLQGMDRREPDDPSPYLLAIWTPGETANSIEPPKQQCQSQEPDKLCNDKTCFSCNSVREATAQTVRGTLLIPCRTAMRGSFPLNGTYFQVNEVFADHESSVNPIDVPRAWLWNLPRRMVYFGTSVSTIFKGLSTEGIQYCFWKGFVCVRGFDQKTRAPRPLKARLHLAASKLAKTKNDKE
ncbi:hypothetical protein Tsubulata_026912 [Turnera subulata]|uniref:HhH-GPD domain-containing protein n=1 Tax=Turnera subulata TaxID=218843 RepID=A0A9Q0GHK8_9ROSI|nr:hypothetical protein Tsubulata_026912 [Turnera subulata]